MAKIDTNLGLRRLRQNRHIRELVREIRLDHAQFIQPIFAVEGIAEREAIPGLNGTFRDTPKTLLQQVEADLKKGISKFLLFGVPSQKGLDDRFTTSQITALKTTFGDDIWLAVDVCLCSNTEHGHCGILNDTGDHVQNKASVAELAKKAADFAESGADCVAPSDMMDGRIAAIRDAIPERTVLMSYAAKFHSNFYGPFRGAADSAPDSACKLTDRATYQIDPAHPSDALRCAQRDAAEGADMMMVKPAMPYLDVLHDLSQQIALPWAAYQVSGECASIELLAENGLTDKRKAYLESWASLTRAGASTIISYAARNAKEWIC